MGEWLSVPVIAPREVIALFIAGSFLIGVACDRVVQASRGYLYGRHLVRVAAEQRVQDRLTYFAGERFPDERLMLPHNHHRR